MVYCWAATEARREVQRREEVAETRRAAAPSRERRPLELRRAAVKFVRAPTGGTAPPFLHGQTSADRAVGAMLYVRVQPCSLVPLQDASQLKCSVFGVLCSHAWGLLCGTKSHSCSQSDTLGLAIVELSRRLLQYVHAVQSLQAASLRHLTAA